MNLVLNVEISFGSKFIMSLRVAWKGADQGNLTFLSPRQNLLRMLGWAIWGGGGLQPSSATSNTIQYLLKLERRIDKLMPRNKCNLHSTYRGGID